METGETKTTGTKQRPKFEAEFKELPLDEKLGSLFRMEAAALEETFHVVADVSVKAFNKAAEVLDDFGTKMSAEFNKARCETEAKTADSPGSKPKGGKNKKNSKPGTEPEVNV
ncbi:MAG: hypothetical protein JO314_04235 [Acidobacteria bacterium]|nr:hypothetical protein [Acidobacteriota bacterium]